MYLVAKGFELISIYNCGISAEVKVWIFHSYHYWSSGLVFIENKIYKHSCCIQIKSYIIKLVCQIYKFRCVYHKYCSYYKYNNCVAPDEWIIIQQLCFLESNVDIFINPIFIIIQFNWSKITSTYSLIKFSRVDREMIFLFNILKIKNIYFSWKIVFNWKKKEKW